MSQHTTIGRLNESTQFRVEAHPDGLWTKKTGKPEPEIRIRKEFNGVPTRYGPSVPLSAVPDLIRELGAWYEQLTRPREEQE
jgi:hypothetical protein